MIVNVKYDLIKIIAIFVIKDKNLNFDNKKHPIYGYNTGHELYLHDRSPFTSFTQHL